MQTNLLWSGREYYSLENCLVDVADTGIEISSTIIGSYEGRIYKVEYLIKADRNWHTTVLKIDSRHSDKAQSISLESDGQGNWKSKDVNAEQFKGCLDVDLPLTPFTNTLPINRLQLGQNEAKEIQVIYVDLLQGEIKPVRQKYTRFSRTRYHYENVPNDFEATIEIDESGFVVDYPGLFVLSAALETNFH